MPRGVQSARAWRCLNRILPSASDPSRPDGHFGWRQQKVRPV